MLAKIEIGFLFELFVAEMRIAKEDGMGQNERKQHKQIKGNGLANELRSEM